MESYHHHFLILGLVRIPLSRRVVWNTYKYSDIFISVGQAILIATATFYIALVYPFIAAVFYFIQKYYLRTSRQLRFMDLEAKSPL
jgi:hypothetical protein